MGFIYTFKGYLCQLLLPVFYHVLVWILTWKKWKQLLIIVENGFMKVSGRLRESLGILKTRPRDYTARNNVPKTLSRMIRRWHSAKAEHPTLWFELHTQETQDSQWCHQSCCHCLWKSEIAAILLPVVRFYLTQTLVLELLANSQSMLCTSHRQNLGFWPRSSCKGGWKSECGKAVPVSVPEAARLRNGEFLSRCRELQRPLSTGK